MPCFHDCHLMFTWYSVQQRYSCCISHDSYHHHHHTPYTLNGRTVSKLKQTSLS